MKSHRPDSADAAGRGCAVSAGIATGELHVDIDDALEAVDAGRSVIIALQTSSPGDVALMIRAAGVITVLGGPESHTAVVARGAGVPAIVSVERLSIEAGRIDLGGEPFPVGTRLTIDGTSGMIWVADG